ncbi:M23 family metallopeptidase [Corynebacterium sp. HS2168-gen11]|uniref:M23 family metallopeptidase n=1 Tax=Corynebacterium sp. HS2168-gen11 TaxID=2974027 RepID=UPI00216AF53A|nr:M23 family metallopeptidase [Corynebacterium sp. HS2168-gen11]MCS4536293.1 M23 family metallopeptidase [Corynebacterium sp. HS2168-gen11]
MCTIHIALISPISVHAQAHQVAEFVNPVTGTQRRPVVLRRFQNPAQRWLTGHRGVDLAAPPGSIIYAAGTGTVLFAGVIAGTGTVSILHANGLRTTYQPVSPMVAAGDAVAAGEPIGLLLASTTSWPGLQWGAKYGAEDYINPLSLLPIPMIRLKPVAGYARG